MTLQPADKIILKVYSSGWIMAFVGLGMMMAYIEFQEAILMSIMDGFLFGGAGLIAIGSIATAYFDRKYKSSLIWQFHNGRLNYDRVTADRNYHIFEIEIGKHVLRL